jgi:predicted MFS family arabinose efflux permease
MQVRSWLTLSLVIAVVQGVLSLLAVLQFNALFSDLLRQRISVIAQTTATSFKPIVNLGLPLSMMRNGDAIVARAIEMDREISAVHVFHPTGAIVYTTSKPRLQTVPREVLRTMQFSDDVKWSVETDDKLFSGFNVVGRDKKSSGAVVVAYPKHRLEKASRQVTIATVQISVTVWVVLSLIAFFVMRALMAAPQRALATLDAAASETGDGPNTKDGNRQNAPDDTSALGRSVTSLLKELSEAREKFDAGMSEIATVKADTTSSASTSQKQTPAPDRQPAGAEITSSSSRSLARLIAARLAPVAAIFIVASAVILGALILNNVNRSIEPELAARTNLVGTVVSDNVQRALAAGVPLDNLVGAEKFFGNMLKQLPEVAYVAVATGRIVLEAGDRIDPYLAPPRERKEVRSHPIMHDGKEVAYVVIDIDPAFISKKFLDVFLDIGVVIIVTILVAFEIMVLIISRSLTAGIDRLHRLAAMQAIGDFSKLTIATARNSIERAIGLLSERARKLNTQFKTAMSELCGSEAGTTALEQLGTRYRLSVNGAKTLRFSYFTDLRLALFLFAAADELPLPFLPLYTRDAENLWPWLDTSVLLSLPVAGYLLAIIIASPFSRGFVQRLGVRPVLVLAALPTLVAHIGLYLAETAQEIIFWRTVSGFGYAFVTLACQDYVLDSVSRHERDRSLGMFTLVLIGGVFAGAAIGGVLADRLGQQNVFIVSTVLIAISALLAVWLIAPGAAKTGTGTEPLRITKVFATLKSARFSALVIGLAVPANVLLQAFISYLLALTLDSLGASTSDIGRTLMLYFLGIIVASSFSGRAAEKGLSVGLLALLGSLLAGASLSFIVLWPTEVTIALAVLGAGIGHGIVRGAQISLAMTLAETELKEAGSTVVLGALRTMERLGSVIGLLLVAAVAGYAGYGAATAVVAVWTLAGAAIFAIYFVGHRQPAQADGTT